MNTDIVVVGGGPAGSTAAKYLAEKGIDVLIIDKENFPRDKPCGGGLPIRVLSDFSYIKKYDLIESYSYCGAAYSSSLKYQVNTEKNTPIIAMVLRKKFDNGLLKIAIDKGAKFHGGNGVKDIKISQDKAQIILKDGSIINSKLVIGADGISSIIRKKTNLNPTKPYIAVCVYKEFFKGEKTITDLFTDKRKIHIFLKLIGIRGYGWVFPKKDSVNIGIGEYITIKDKNDKKNNLKEVYSSYLSLLKKQKIITEDFNEKDIIGGSFIFWPLEKTYSNRVLLCGDAAGFTNPLTGEGIYYAMASGQLASEVVISSLENENFSERFLSNYQKIWRNDFGKDLNLLVKSTRTWGSDSERFIKMASKNDDFAEMCLSIMTGERSIHKMRWKLIRKFLSIVVKEKLKRN